MGNWEGGCQGEKAGYPPCDFDVLQNVLQDKDFKHDA